MDPINGHQVRLRIAHTFTKSGGWRAETTVDLTGNANDPTDVLAQLDYWLREVDNRARAESRTRNTIDRFDDAAA
jgi:hypothetical protein